LLSIGEYYPDYDENNSRKSKLIDLGIFCIFIGFIFVSVLNCVVNCVYSHLPVFLGYILEDAPPIVKLPMAYIVPCICLWIIFFNAFSLICGFYGYGMYIVPFLSKELKMGGYPYETPSKLRQPQNLIVAYRALQLFQQVVNSLMGKFIVPTQTIVTKLIIISCYMAIRHGDEMEKATIALLLTWSGLAGIFWASTLMLGGYLHMYGEKTLLSWKYHQWNNKFDNKLMSKFRKSCKPIMVSFGHTYKIRRLSVLKFVRGLSRGILRALLAL